MLAMYVHISGNKCCFCFSIESLLKNVNSEKIHKFLFLEMSQKDF